MASARPLPAHRLTSQDVQSLVIFIMKPTARVQLRRVKGHREHGRHLARVGVQRGGRVGRLVPVQNPRGATRPEAPTHTHCTAFSHTAAPSTAHETEQRKRRRMGEHTRCKRCKTLHELTICDASMYMCMRNECGVYMFMRHDARTYSCCSLRVTSKTRAARASATSCTDDLFEN